jgi:hypothetical protein
VIGLDLHGHAVAEAASTHNGDVFGCSRVNAASRRLLAQPFYGWGQDGWIGHSPLQRAFLNGLSQGSWKHAEARYLRID